ncbi:General stress protein 69 [Polystyrenella longa]|uniref:General stress protein 69 n=1 Tax=Polystyrenella longa TaxID=2528007 RepID=A0A518CP81_9PLAN|nr:aldo/keto reductase [Polystyrenella longa]QDU81032.1 General stress protein 69 [Polystyrenella longa]
MKQNEIGNSGIQVTQIAMGCWPIAGVTTVGVTKQAAMSTLRGAFESGINFFDTAFVYGYEGESEKYIAEALGGIRDEIVLATKGGSHWEEGKNKRGGRPERLTQELEESLKRLKTDVVDLYYLHGPDPECPIEESAEAVARFVREGKAKSAGLCNATLDEIKRFHAICPLSAYQGRFSMLQQEVTEEILPWCRENNVSFMPFWLLMKGLLAGKIERDHQFEEGDTRKNYPLFQGEQWQRNQDFVDVLRSLAQETGHTVSQLVVNWTISLPGVTAALCGARRPEQIRETAIAAEFSLSDAHRQQIEDAITERLKYEH